MDKAELHAHLNGSIPVSTVRDLGASPDDYLITEPVRDFSSYFRPWTLSRALASSHEALRLIVRGVASAFQEDNVRYAEVRNSVRHLAALNAISWEEAIEWLLISLEEASHASGIDLRLIITLTREGFVLDQAERMLDACAPYAYDKRLVGVDLAGDELTALPPDAAKVFRRAGTELGLGVTIHAGESPGMAENVLWAIDECRANRIGHATAAVESDEVLDKLVSSGACVEVCLTSNWLTSSTPDLALHPVRIFVERGVNFVICTDNPGVHDVPLSAEYESFFAITGAADLLGKMYERQIANSFGLNK